MSNFLPVGTRVAVSGVLLAAAVHIFGVPHSQTQKERLDRLGTALLASGGTSLLVTPLLLTGFGACRRRLVAALDQ